MKTLSELQIIAEGKYPNNGPIIGNEIDFIRYAYIQGCLDTQEESGWVSVEERLPEIGTEVNVLLEFGVVTSLCRLIRYEGATDFYWDNHYGGSNWHAAKVVIKWQPLPNPPKEK